MSANKGTKRAAEELAEKKLPPKKVHEEEDEVDEEDDEDLVSEEEELDDDEEDDDDDDSEEEVDDEEDDEDEEEDDDEEEEEDAEDVDSEKDVDDEDDQDGVSDEEALEEDNVEADLSLDEQTSSAVRAKIAHTTVKDSNKMTPGVIYLGHIPFGFFESQIRAFFTQFGTVDAVKVSRSRKTARSKGYAFVRFVSHEVAQIAADTMNNYLMHGRVLKAHVIPNEKVHSDTFKDTHRKFRRIDWVDVDRKRRNAPKTKEQHEKTVKHLLDKESQRRQKFSKLGIQYEFPGYGAAVPVANGHQ